MKDKLYFNWSTGKDSALALHYLLNDSKFDIAYLLTAINSHYDRVSMHGLRRVLMEEQIKVIGIDYGTIELPEEPSMEEYEKIMQTTVHNLKEKGFNNCAFGDIFLEDLRNYRENQLAKYNIKAHFPLWNKNTKDVITEFMALGFKAIVISAKADVLDKSFVGRIIDEQFIADLPKNVDPCGENGEFHTFCFDGPIFSKPVHFKIGDIVYKSYKTPKKDTDTTEKEESDQMGFWYCDLLPIETN